jgi:hypothetical protein
LTVPPGELGECVERIAPVARQQHERVEEQVGDLADLLVGAWLGSVASSPTLRAACSRGPLRRRAT